MKLKKIVGVVLATALCLASSMTAFAAGISTDEQAIIDKLKAGVEVDGVVIQIPTELINQVENEFTKNETDITADQAQVVTDKIDAVIQIAQDENLTTAEDIKGAADEILPIVKDAATEIGYTVAYDASAGDFAVTDANGDTVYTSKDVINQTGFDLTSTFVVGGVIVTLLAACIVFANKKKLFAKTTEA